MMRILGIFFSLLLLPLSAALAEPGQSQSAPDEEQLVRSLGLPVERVSIPLGVQQFLGGASPARFPAMFLKSPLKASAHLVRITSGIGAAKTSWEILNHTSQLLDRPVDRSPQLSGLDGWIGESENPLNLWTLLVMLGAKYEQRSLFSLPLSLRKALYVLLAAQMNANSWVILSQDSVVPDIQNFFWDIKRIYLWDPAAAPFAERISFRIYTKAIPDFNLTPLLIAASDLLAAIEWAAAMLHQESIPFASIETGYGTIEIGGVGVNVYGTRPPNLLSIDLGGDDLYREAGRNDPQIQASSVSLDLAGNDRYESFGRSPSLGSGTLGIGVLLDLSGDDVYRGSSRSQGTGQYGVGLLIDRSGNDRYEAEFESQGAAVAGVGILIDESGDDRYESFAYSQAFAGPNSAALLFDRSGNDSYQANESEIRFPSRQDKKHNSSMSQGVASGIRPFKKGAINLPGGVALLFDALGDDSYSAGVFAQGVGYWYGAGNLLDGGGNDRYHAHWYAQGAAAHFGSGVLLDQGGDDQYTAKGQMALGAGHDAGSGVLIDNSGDDRYEAPRLALGTSNDSGLGIFVDWSGDDEFCLGSPELGGWISEVQGDDPRAKLERWALFFDVEGEAKTVGFTFPQRSRSDRVRLLQSELRR